MERLRRGSRRDGRGLMLSLWSSDQIWAACFGPISTVILGCLPSGYVKIATENGPFIVDLPIANGDMLNYGQD